MEINSIQREQETGKILLKDTIPRQDNYHVQIIYSFKLLSLSSHSYVQLHFFAPNPCTWASPPPHHDAVVVIQQPAVLVGGNAYLHHTAVRQHLLGEEPPQQTSSSRYKGCDTFSPASATTTDPVASVIRAVNFHNEIARYCTSHCW